MIVQAGSSTDGQDFAAQWTEVVFTDQQTLDQDQAYGAAPDPLEPHEQHRRRLDPPPRPAAGRGRPPPHHTRDSRPRRSRV